MNFDQRVASQIGNMALQIMKLEQTVQELQAQLAAKDKELQAHSAVPDAKH